LNHDDYVAGIADPFLQAMSSRDVGAVWSIR